MSKRRALSSSTLELDPEPVPAKPSVVSLNNQGSMQLDSRQTEVLKQAIVEAGGPFWDRVLQMHGSQGTLSKTFAHFKPHHLWRATGEMYCDLLDRRSQSAIEEPLPVWAQFASKSVTMSVGGSGIREREVVQASFDAYGWSREEDNVLISLLEMLQQPAWREIYHLFTTKHFPGSIRSQQDLENRAVVLHRYHSYFHPLDVPLGLHYLRTSETSSFGLPWNVEWSEDEDAKLLDGISKTRGPYWGKILGMYGASGINGNQLASKSETELANRAREWWVAASGQQRKNIDSAVLEVLQYIQPKGFTTTGMPTSRGWSEEQDEVLINELNVLKAPNYNEILIRHGVNGRVSDKLAPKNYAQLRGRALKLLDFCIREKRPMPAGLQYAKRKD